MLGAAHLVLLLVHHQLFVKLFTGAQAHDLDLHIHTRLVAVKADELLGQVHNAHRLAHIQHIDIAALCQCTRLQHQLGCFRDGHKVAHDVGVSQGDRPALFDLGFKQRDNAAVAAQHVAKADRHALHVGVARKGLDEHLTDPLGAAHHAGWIDRLVVGKLNEPLHVVLQAGALAEGGSIYVLDMGEPVKIMDLAKQLIRFYGYEPGVNMEIKIVGLRPGEKLYEELMMDEEQGKMRRTEHNKIFVASPRDIDLAVFYQQLQDLAAAAQHNDEGVVDQLEKMIPTFTPTRKNLKV